VSFLRRGNFKQRLNGSDSQRSQAAMPAAAAGSPEIGAKFFASLGKTGELRSRQLNALMRRKRDGGMRVAAGLKTMPSTWPRA